MIKHSYKVDPVGALFSSLWNHDPAGDIGIEVHLKEKVDRDVFLKAVDDIVARLPFINVGLKSGIMWWYHKIRNRPMPINKANDKSLMKFFCEDYCFKIMTMHSVCDGRGLVSIMKAVVARYFEILGVEFDKVGIINHTDPLKPEEMEDAFKRYARTKKRVFGKNKRLFVKSYKTGSVLSRQKPSERIVYTFELDKIKEKAKKYGATINEYILTRIFQAIADEREESGDKRQISINVPFDLRRFFPSETLRNFTSGFQIMMPETTDTAIMVKKLRKEFQKIDEDCILADIKSIRRLCRLSSVVPRIVKKPFLKRFAIMYSNRLSANFSNIGFITFPSEIEEKITNIEVFNQCYPNTPFAFVCVSWANTLNLMLTKPVCNEVFLDMKKRIMEEEVNH
ncbi:MAG: hypothetical protein FWC11_04685 [Firmicutes bacterium]|nr:hypothetical protein [Bacillota bacterium]MCL2256138.1 hypothetical protein [Bacillota bacterium]